MCRLTVLPVDSKANKWSAHRRAPEAWTDQGLFLITVCSPSNGKDGNVPKNANMHKNHPNLSRCVPKVTRMTLWEAGTHIKACVPSSIPLLVERALGEATACSWLFMDRGPILHKSHTFQRWISQKGRLHHLPQLKRHLLLLFHHKYTDSTKQCPCRPHFYKLSAIECSNIWRKVSYLNSPEKGCN